MKTIKIDTKKWIGALAVIPALVLLSACEPRDDDPMVTDPADEQETEWGQRDRDMDPAQDPAYEEPAPAQPADDPALEDQEQDDSPAY